MWVSSGKPSSQKGCFISTHYRPICSHIPFGCFLVIFFLFNFFLSFSSFLYMLAFIIFDLCCLQSCVRYGMINCVQEALNLSMCHRMPILAIRHLARGLNNLRKRVFWFDMNKQTNIHTDRLTSQLYDWIGRAGTLSENFKKWSPEKYIHSCVTFHMSCVLCHLSPATNASSQSHKHSPN